MASAKKKPKQTITHVLAQMELAWVVYVGALGLLTLFEALAKPEVGFDTILDSAILAAAFFGCAAAWLLSAWLFLRRKRENRTMALALRFGVCSFAGPALALCVILGIDGLFGSDIDGGSLLFYLAFLAIVLPVLCLPVVRFSWIRR